MDESRYEKAQILQRTDWDEGLFSITLSVSRDFTAGQYAVLAKDPDDPGERIIQRAYSIVSEPGALLELYVVEVEQGAITPSLYRAKVGDDVWVSTRTTGLFRLGRVKDAKTLWWLATGTGIAPFISMLRCGKDLDRFENIVLVHGVRKAAQLGYRAECERFAAQGQITYVPMVSRDPDAGLLTGRIPARLADGSLAQAAGVALDEAKDCLMLCGNPAMIEELAATYGAERMKQRVYFERFW